MEIAPANNLSKNRIESELKSLLDLQDITYKVSHRQNRTLVYVQMYPAKQNTINLEEENIQQSEIRYVSYNLDDGCLSKEPLYFQQHYSSQKLQLQEVNQFESRGQSSKRYKNNSFVFLIILYQQLYPFQAPFVTICKSTLFPRVQDMGDYFYQIMKSDIWWPLITLKQIILKLPNFAYKLEKMHYKRTEVKEEINGSNYPLYLADIRENIQSLLIIKGKTSTKNKSFGQRIIIFSCKKIQICSCNKEENIQIEEVIQLSKLDKIEHKITKKDKIVITLYSNIESLIKINLQRLKQQQLTKLKFYLLYYQLPIIKGRKTNRLDSQFIPQIEQYQKFIELADFLNDKQAISWARQCLQKLMNLYNL